MKECFEKDCERETFEEEVRKFEEKESSCERERRFDDRRGRKVECKCDFPQFRFICRCIDIREKRVILDMCDCGDVCLCDGQPFEFTICPCVPREACVAPRQVFVRVGKREFPLTDRIGDFVFDNQIISHKGYFGYYGSDPEHVISMNVLRIPRY